MPIPKQKIIETLLTSTRPIILMLDFDGTLSKISDHPKEAKIDRGSKTALKKLSKNKNVRIAIISGRQLEEIKNKVALDGLSYSGNHGLEWIINSKNSQYKLSKKFQNELAQADLKLKNFSKKIPGSFVENKNLTITFHFRKSQKKIQKNIPLTIRYLLNDILKKGHLRIHTGKASVEIRPKNNWNKSSFAKLFIEFQQPIKDPYIIYVGDDSTDEDAFLALRNEITFKVGNGRTLAQYRFRSHLEVSKFLSALAKTKTRN